MEFEERVNFIRNATAEQLETVFITQRRILDHTFKTSARGRAKDNTRDFKYCLRDFGRTAPLYLKREVTVNTPNGLVLRTVYNDRDVEWLRKAAIISAIWNELGDSRKYNFSRGFKEMSCTSTADDLKYNETLRLNELLNEGLVSEEDFSIFKNGKPRIEPTRARTWRLESGYGAKAISNADKVKTLVAAII